MELSLLICKMAKEKDEEILMSFQISGNGQ